jgi:23S rRNA (guanosine2251-2'-O)-methyltransferase
MNSGDNWRRRGARRSADSPVRGGAPRPDTLVVGRIPVEACLRSRRRPARKLYYLESGRGVEALLRLAAPTVTEACSRHELDMLTGGAVHQGVALLADPLPLWTLTQWLAEKATATSTVVVLDGVEDPHNFGAVVRSAAGLGGAAVLFGKDRAAPISPASVKAAAGAMEYVDLIQETNLSRALEQLKQEQFWTYALTAEGEADLWEVELGGRVAVVVGSEGEGIRRLVLESCDFRVRIPISGPISSLNASVSAAIALAELARQRRSQG